MCVLARVVCVIAVAVAAAIAGTTNAPAQTASVDRGKYIFDSAGCYACHTAKGGSPLAGGDAIRTPFGTFFAPNITPDPTNGIGNWSDANFIRALREGVSPSGEHYFPVFPYGSYTKMTVQDLLDLKAYLGTITPVKKPSRTHEVSFPFSIRMALIPWTWLNFDPGEFVPDTGRDPKWNRGAYLVQALAHCGECHTPRNWIGGLERDKWLSGARMPTGDLVASNLPPDKTGLAGWSVADIGDALADGTLPQGGTLGGEMGEVVRNSTSRMRADDREAIAIYLKSLPTLATQVKRKSK